MKDSGDRMEAINLCDGLQRSELFGDDERGMVGKHDPA